MVVVARWSHGSKADHRQRADLPTPMVIFDTMADLVHPATGVHCSSKSEFRKITKARGLVEVGDAPVMPHSDSGSRVTKDDIGEALQKVKQGYVPTLGAPDADLD